MTKKPIYVVTDYDGCPYITAGKAYRVVERHSEDDFRIVDDEGDEIYINVCASNHFEGEAGWHIIDTLQDEQTAQDQEVTLRPGDYVLTSELRDEAHYREVGEAFMRAGAEDERATLRFSRWKEMETLGWCQSDGLWLGREGGIGIIGEGDDIKRQLTPDQVIAAAPAAPTPERQFKAGDRVRVNGHRHEHQFEGEHCYGTSRTMKQWERDGTILEVAYVRGDFVDAGVHGCGPDYSFHPSELDLVQDEPTAQTPDHPTQQTRSERAEWARYAAAALATGKSPADAAMAAEELMRIRRERLSG